MIFMLTDLSTIPDSMVLIGLCRFPYACGSDRVTSNDVVAAVAAKNCDARVSVLYMIT